MVSNLYLQFARDPNLESVLLKKTQPIGLHVVIENTFNQSLPCLF